MSGGLFILAADDTAVKVVIWVAIFVIWGIWSLIAWVRRLFKKLPSQFMTPTLPDSPEVQRQVPFGARTMALGGVPPVMQRQQNVQRPKENKRRKGKPPAVPVMRTPDPAPPLPREVRERVLTEGRPVREAVVSPVQIRQAFGNPRTLRQAWVLGEVLKPPVALRE